MSEITYLEAIRAAIADAMREDERVFLLGEDIGHFGGPFGVTKGLLEEFGEAADRHADLGGGLRRRGDGRGVDGRAADRRAAVRRLHHLPVRRDHHRGAKTHWRSGIRLPIVIRAPFGGGIRGGPFHASCPEGWFIGTAGLKVVCPGRSRTRTACSGGDRRRRPGPLLRAQGALPAASRRAAQPAHRTPIGRARVLRSGGDATLVTYGAGVDIALRATEELDVEVVDLRTLWPLDEQAILESLAKTSRLLVLQEASRSSGVAEPRPVTRRAGGLRPPRCAARPRRPARYSRSVRARARGRVHPVRRAGAGRAGGAACVLRPSGPHRLSVAPAVDAPSVPRDVRLRLFDLMLLQRVAEDRIMALYRQGRIPGSVYTGRGQEAVAAAAGTALGAGRRRPAAQPRAGEPLRAGGHGCRRLAQLLRKGNGPDSRPRRQHALRQAGQGRLPARLHARRPRPGRVGAALAFKRRGEARVALTFLGEGAFCVGDVHEGLNLAGVLRVPAVFVIQNNQYAYSTPTGRRWSTRHRRARARRLAFPCARVDGTDALADLRGDPGRRRAGARRGRPAGRRGADSARPRTRRARRRELRSRRASRPVR